VIRKLTTDKRKSVDASGEVGRLYDRVVDWLYERQNSQHARGYARRLRRMVEESDPKAESIFTQECLSLAHEAEGDLEQAIRHRENEIRLIFRLHEFAQGQDATHADFLFGQYSYEDLRDRLHLLAALYHASGKLDKAIRILQESKVLCEKHGIEFDWEDVLQEYLTEQQNPYNTSWATIVYVPVMVIGGDVNFRFQSSQISPKAVFSSSARH
jgi:hypothetical protein